MYRRDQIAEQFVQHTRENRGNCNDETHAKNISSTAVKYGSRGLSEHAKSGLPYWHLQMCEPLATYHTTIFGPGKDFPGWNLVRMHVRSAPADEMVLPFRRGKDIRSLMQARLKHIVLRNKPDCILPDFTSVLGAMTISETQLLWEVAVPYLVHDACEFGMPRPVCVMWLLLRHGMLCFTRLLCGNVTKEKYERQLLTGQQCMHAFAAIAEFFHRAEHLPDSAIAQFAFSWKLHGSAAHLRQQMQLIGHCIQGSDLWVERLMRMEACIVVKCAPLFLLSTQEIHSNGMYSDLDW